MAAFTALRLESQVKRFGRSALNVGLTRTEVIEAVIQTAPFGDLELLIAATCRAPVV